MHSSCPGMNISFECIQCEADFDLDSVDLVRNPSQLVCPNCGSKANPEVVEAIMTSLDELFSQLTRLRKKFRVALEMEFDELDDELAEQYDDDEALWSNDVDNDEEED
jgi:DNA-directed RNA polymerase subunit RPC12/RpoP